MGKSNNIKFEEELNIDGENGIWVLRRDDKIIAAWVGGAEEIVIDELFLGEEITRTEASFCLRSARTNIELEVAYSPDYLTPTNLTIAQHHLWSNWMRYLFGWGYEHEDGSITLPAEAVKRWTRQMNSSFHDLLLHEQESDRAVVDELLLFIEGLEHGDK